MQHINQTRLYVVCGSLLDQDVQAIVNATNEGMRGGGGIDGLIHRQAGPQLLVELKRVAPNGARTGTAVLTRGYNLKQPFVIHTPGPVWSAERANEAEHLLRSCYRSCLEVAESQQIENLGFCSISTGIYGYPIAAAAPVAVDTVVQYLREHPQTPLQEVVFAMYGEEEFKAFKAALQQVDVGSVPLQTPLHKIQEAFATYFAPWKITLPEEDVTQRRRGSIQEQGWHILYLFGRNERGEYMDFYATHRMTNARHERLYASGDQETLESYLEFMVYPQDASEAQKNQIQQDYYQHNRRVNDELRAKRFE